MASGYQYKPKGIDISISASKKRKKKKPEELPCEWAGCTEMGGCKAPMTDEDIQEWQVGVRHGHRPTWDVRKNTGERAKAQKKRRAGHTAATAEGYNIFGDGEDGQTEAPRSRRLSKLQIKALNDMGLDDTRTKASAIRKKASSASSPR